MAHIPGMCIMWITRLRIGYGFFKRNLVTIAIVDARYDSERPYLRPWFRQDRDALTFYKVECGDPVGI